MMRRAWIAPLSPRRADETGPMLDDDPSETVVKRSERKVDHRFDAATGEVELIAATGFEPTSPPGRFRLGALPAACPAHGPQTGDICSCSDSRSISACIAASWRCCSCKVATARLA